MIKYILQRCYGRDRLEDELTWHDLAEWNEEILDKYTREDFLLLQKIQYEKLDPHSGFRIIKRDTIEEVIL